jgi:hypothetical protein
MLLLAFWWHVADQLLGLLSALRSKPAGDNLARGGMPTEEQNEERCNREGEKRKEGHHTGESPSPAPPPEVLLRCVVDLCAAFLGEAREGLLDEEMPRRRRGFTELLAASPLAITCESSGGASRAKL